MSVKKCPGCGTPYRSNASNFCSHCGSGRLGSHAPEPSQVYQTSRVSRISGSNHCTNPDCENFDAVLGVEDRHCDLCGAYTPYGKELADRLGQLGP